MTYYHVLKYQNRRHLFFSHLSNAGQVLLFKLFKPGTWNAEHGTQNAERGTQNAERRTQNAERRTQNSERGTRNTEHETRNAERGTRNTKRGTRDSPGIISSFEPERHIDQPDHNRHFHQRTNYCCKSFS